MISAYNFIKKRIEEDKTTRLTNVLVQMFLIFALLMVIDGNVFAAGFNSLYSSDGIVVIAVGDNGNVFRSSNGGAGFASYPQGSLNLNSVYAINSSVWIAAGSGKILISSNSGMTYTTNVVTSETLRSIFFADANTGWVVGDNGTIMKTINGGMNWNSQNSNVTSHLFSVKFSDPLNGVACGSGGKVIYTTDGGASWLPHSTPTSENLTAVDIKGNKIIATGERGFIIKFNGASWSMIDYKIEVKSEVKGISMLDENTFYTCGGGGFIRKTVDGGASFTFQQNPMMGNLVDIHFYDAGKGWAVSSKNNAIIRTTDGGNLWSLPTGTAVNFSWTLKQSGSGNIGNGFCLHPFNKKTIFVAMGKKVYRSVDLGENWTQISTISAGQSAHTFFVSSVDSNYWLASMDASSGRVMRSTNYGVDWSVVWGPGALTSYGMPLIADQNVPNQVYLNPDNSVLLKSTNWGLNWTNVGTQVFRSPDNITIAWENPNIIYSGDGVTGSGVAELFKTTNGGINWTLVHTVTGSEIPFTVVTSLDPKLSYHTCWSSGGVWKSTDMWSTFSQVATTSSAWAADISKDDPTAIAYGVYGSNVYISTNSGQNFTSTPVGSSPEAGMLFYDRGNLFSQKGGGVYKLNIVYDVPTYNEDLSIEIPKQYRLYQNYPNPFNPSTSIKYEITSAVNVILKVFDIAGKEVASLVNENQKPGYYSVDFNAEGLSSGIYFYTLYAGDITLSNKMILLK